MRKIANKTLVSLGVLALGALMNSATHAQQQTQADGSKQSPQAHTTDWYVDHAYDELARFRTMVVNALSHARELENHNCYSTAQGVLGSVGVAANVLRDYDNNPKAYVARWNRNHPSDKATSHSMAKYIAEQIVGNSSRQGRSVLQSAGCLPEHH